MGGKKAKFRMNMDAINLLKELEFDGRQATPEEQEVLSRYVGWGGLAEAFEEGRENWSDEFKELYIRLSVEDTRTNSISIETQQLILDHYLESQPEMFVYDTYIDNGATGTNFHRPGFQQMLSDIEAGHVNCVIVKDLSRLGRNSIDTGYYIEQYFPQHKVRFIAVTDQYDSANPNDVHAGIILPLKNMIKNTPYLEMRSTKSPIIRQSPIQPPYSTKPTKR